MTCIMALLYIRLCCYVSGLGMFDRKIKTFLENTRNKDVVEQEVSLFVSLFNVSFKCYSGSMFVSNIKA